MWSHALIYIFFNPSSKIVKSRHISKAGTLKTI